MKDVIIIILLLLIVINTYFTSDYNLLLSDMTKWLYNIYDILCDIKSELKKLNKE